jgi:hypothetical protein
VVSVHRGCESHPEWVKQHSPLEARINMSVIRRIATIGLMLSAMACLGGRAEAGDESATRHDATTAKAGRVSASGELSSRFSPEGAFDATSESAGGLWLSGLNVAPAWLEYDFVDKPRRVTSYAILFTNRGIETRAPKEFELQGHNGTEWVTLSAPPSQPGWTSGENRKFKVESPQEYLRYRLFITEDNDARRPIVTVSITELTLTE